MDLLVECPEDDQPTLDITIKTERRERLREEKHNLPSLLLSLARTFQGLRYAYGGHIRELQATYCAVRFDYSLARIETANLFNKAVLTVRRTIIEKVGLGQGTTLVADRILHAAVMAHSSASLLCEHVDKVSLRVNTTLKMGGTNDVVRVGQMETESKSEVRSLRASHRERRVHEATNSDLIEIQGPETSQLDVSAIEATGAEPLNVWCSHWSSVRIRGASTFVHFHDPVYLATEQGAVLTRCRFEKAHLEASPATSIQDCDGTLVLADARETTLQGPVTGGKALILGQYSQALDLARPSEFTNPLPEKTLEKAVLRHFTMIGGSGRTRLLTSAKESSIFDPVLKFPRRRPMFRRSDIRWAPDTHTGTDELLGQVCSEKSTLGSTRSIAEYGSMEARRRRVDSRLEWWLLSIYRLVGYGRRPATATICWLLCSLLAIGWRLRDGVSTTNVDVLVKAGLSTAFPPLAVITKETPLTSPDLMLRVAVAAALAFLVVALTRYGRISRKTD
ncbi:hypothetical protein [Actinomycetospora chlora]|uniref:hypothetical protein n=1 Tax=Actinomycetospora chlora TaxID=663608 RepID=UPI0031EF84FB